MMTHTKVRFLTDYNGRLTKHRVFESGDFGVFQADVAELLIGRRIARLTEPDDALAENTSTRVIEGGVEEEAVEEVKEEPIEIHASRAARRYAIENGIDLSEVEGTGRGGQITVKDVKAA